MDIANDIPPTDGPHGRARGAGEEITPLAQSSAVSPCGEAPEKDPPRLSLNDMINGIPCGIAIIDCYFDGRIEDVYVNGECQKMISVGGSDSGQVDAYNVLEVVHPADRQGLLDEIRSCARESRDGSFDFRILMADESVKWLNARSRVAFKTDIKHTLYVVYTDIDQNKHHQLALAASYRAMSLAGRDASIAFWRYDLDRRIMTRTVYDARANADETSVENVPESIIVSGDVASEDADKVLAMYGALDNGAERSECTVRMLNRETGRFEWLHNIYTRIYDPMYQTRQAIGIAINVDLEQDLNQRYEHELRLRQGLTRDSQAYFQLNLTTGAVEEYTTLQGGSRKLTRFTLSPAEFRETLLSGIIPEDRDAVEDTLFMKGLEKAYENGCTSATRDYRTINGKGEMRWLRGVATIIKRPGTDEVIAFVYCNDITDAKKSQLALESILQEDIDAVMLVSVKTGLARMIKTNGDLEDMAAGAEADYDGHLRKMLGDGVIEDDENASFRDTFTLARLIEILGSRSFATLTHRARNREGLIRWKRTLAYYLDASRGDIVLSRRDITAIHEEERRRKLALEAALEEAERANNAKKEFISRMSHDMRTAMNAVVGFVRLLKGEEMSSRATEYLNGIDSSGKFLSGLIQDILDIDGISRGSVKFAQEPLSPGEFKRAIPLMVQPLMDEKNIAFTWDLDGFEEAILIDKPRFYQIITHLLSNAAKYTPEGGKVALSFKRLAPREGKLGLRFTVSDDGRGISEEFQRVIFEPFTQEADPSRTRLHGSGLGLALVKSLLTAMDGDISVKSKLGAGSVFTVDLYAKSVNPEKPADTGSDEHEALRGLRVLIVEDNELNSRIIGMLLEHVGCVTDYAVNGLEATEKFAASPLDYYKAILMDIRMPVMDGLEATRNIRMQPRPDARSVPVISVTADVLSETKDNPRQAGITAQLTKPIDADKLFATIEECVKSAI